MEKQLVGKVSHFFPKPSVAVVEVSAPLKVGDKIVIESHAGSFEQTVESMQIEHEQIEAAKPGQSIGLKTLEHVHEGNLVYKLE